MQVYISSGTHVSGVEDRVAEISDQLEAPDIVFGEGGKATLLEQVQAIVYLFPRAPLVSAAAALQVFVIYPIGGWLASVVTKGRKGRDVTVMQQISSKYEAPICEIDTVHTAHPVYQRPIVWGVANWLPLFGLPAVFTQSSSLLIAAIQSVLWLTLIGYLLFYIMLYLANTKREDMMATTIRSHASDVETACIVLGETHHVGIGRRLSGSDKIDIINPTPANMGVLTRFNLYSWKLADRLRK